MKLSLRGVIAIYRLPGYREPVRTKKKDKTLQTNGISTTSKPVIYLVQALGWHWHLLKKCLVGFLFGNTQGG